MQNSSKALLKEKERIGPGHVAQIFVLRPVYKL
jgi:hypothetical protein